MWNFQGKLDIEKENSKSNLHEKIEFREEKLCRIFINKLNFGKENLVSNFNEKMNCVRNELPVSNFHEKI